MTGKRNFYQEGFDTGVTWEENYRPGGPYRCTDVRWPGSVARDKADSEAWFRGFDDGLERKKNLEV